MKNILLILILLLSANLNAREYGYKIVVTNYVSGGIESFKTTDVAFADSVFFSTFQFDIDVESRLNYAVTHFQYINSNKSFYIEKKIAVLNKRNKVKFRRIRK